MLKGNYDNKNEYDDKCQNCKMDIENIPDRGKTNYLLSLKCRHVICTFCYRAVDVGEIYPTCKICGKISKTIRIISYATNEGQPKNSLELKNKIKKIYREREEVAKQNKSINYYNGKKNITKTQVEDQEFSNAEEKNKVHQNQQNMKNMMFSEKTEIKMKEQKILSNIEQQTTKREETRLPEKDNIQTQQDVLKWLIVDTFDKKVVEKQIVQINALLSTLKERVIKESGKYTEVIIRFNDNVNLLTAAIKESISEEFLKNKRVMNITETLNSLVNDIPEWSNWFEKISTTKTLEHIQREMKRHWNKILSDS